MNRILSSFILILCFSGTLQAGEPELQGYGVFNQLNKDWMLLALYSEQPEDASRIHIPQRLEIKIVTKKFSQRRFRQLWLDAFAVEYGPQKMTTIQAELKQFFDILLGPLKLGDSLIIRRTEINGVPVTDVILNYHNLAQLSEGFLDIIVRSLTGKHPPTQLLKSGLMGDEGIRYQTDLAIRFDRLEPTLPRIAEISRWGKRLLSHNTISASK